MSEERRADLLLRAQFKRAMDLRQEGRHEETREILAMLWEKFPEERGPLSWMLSGSLLDLGRPEEGIPFARQAVEGAPGSLNPSLTLFHCLWGAQRLTEAFDEMVRFLSLKRSKHYEELAEGLLSESSELKERAEYHELRNALVEKLSRLERYRDQFTQDGELKG